MTLRSGGWIRHVVGMMVASRPSGQLQCWTHEVRDTGQHQKIFKEQPLTVMILLTSGTKHQWNWSKTIFSLPSSFCCTNKRQAVGIYLFLQAWELAVLQIWEILIINPTSPAQNSTVSLFLSALNLGTHFSSLLRNFLCCIFFSE